MKSGLKSWRYGPRTRTIGPDHKGTELLGQYETGRIDIDFKFSLIG